VDDISEGARLCFRSDEEVGETESTKVDERARICPSASCWHMLEFVILRQLADEICAPILANVS
jgi:hypothetical protein